MIGFFLYSYGTVLGLTKLRVITVSLMAHAGYSPLILYIVYSTSGNDLVCVDTALSLTSRYAAQDGGFLQSAWRH